MSQEADGIREFFANAFNGYELRNDENIFELGFVNSLFAMELVEFVESRFEIEVDTDDLEIENFSTISGMVALVARKREAQAA